MDPLNIATNIIKLACKIKGALETVEDNKELCSRIRETVETIGDILKSADNNTKIMASGMCRSLRNLGNAMEKALNLIRDCQGKSRLAHFLTVDQMSKKLKDANQTIIQSMEIVQFAMTSLQPAPSTVILTPSPDTHEKEDPYDNSIIEENEDPYDNSRIEENEYPYDNSRIEGNEDPYDNSRIEENEWYYSCSSSCSVSLLKAMIKDLTEENIVSQNDNYIMYKLILSDGAHVAVHRIGRFGTATKYAERDIRVRGTSEFEHINILELLGYFSYGGLFYMVDVGTLGVLSRWIYDDHSAGMELSWQLCSDIILDIADGVVYLHDCGIIHMSLLPEKVEIDHMWVAKISYFDISQKLTQSDQEGVVTALQMERGFAPPEYERSGIYSVKTDVYSYGVLLLELITGQMCNQGGDNYSSLIESVLQQSLANKMVNCIQPRLMNAAADRQIEDIKRCIRIALLCVEEDPALRPTMHDVRWWLMNKNEALPRISATRRTKAR